MQRAVIYARVSTKEQDSNHSIPSQIEGAKEYARRNGMQIVAVHHEDASGLVYPRPKLEQALQALEEGAADVIIAHTEDRLNRHEINGFLIRKRIADAETELHYTLSGKCDLGDEYRMLSMIKDAIAANEVRAIGERMQRGKRHKAKSGAWIGLGKAPYGYRVVGEGKNMRLEIVEEEARIVRQIFESYVYEKMSVQQIMSRLVALGVPRPGVARSEHKSVTARPNQWNVHAIYRILNNETYAGRFYAYRWKMVGKTKRVERPRDEWIEIPVPAIVDDESFTGAQLRLSVKTDTFRQRRYQYMMAGCLTCGVCGYKLSTMPANYGKQMYYRCYSYRDRHHRREKCALPAFRVQLVDSAVWDCIKSLMRSPEGFRQAVEEAREQAQQDHSQLYADIAAIETEMDRQQVRLEQAVQLFLDNQGDDKRFIREAAKRSQDESNKLLEDLHRERDLLSRKVVEVQISDDTLEAINAYAAELASTLDELTMEERRSVVDALGATAVLAIEEGQRVAYLTVLLQEVRIELQNDLAVSLYTQTNLKLAPSSVALTFRLIIAPAAPAA